MVYLKKIYQTTYSIHFNETIGSLVSPAQSIKKSFWFPRIRVAYMCLMLEPGSKFGFNPGRAPRFAARTLRTLELQTLRCVVMAGRLAGALGGATDCKVICFVGAFLRLRVLPCCGFMISALHLLRSKTNFKIGTSSQERASKHAAEHRLYRNRRNLKL